MALTVEIVGVDHRNKGAVLMLEAVMAELRRALPHVRLAVPLTIPVEERMARGLYGAMPRDRGRRDLAGWANYVPRGLRRELGLAAPDDIDVRLDISGFAYGDFWGPLKLQRRLLGPLRRWRKGDRLHVLLPQALGPFSSAEMKAAFAEAVAGLDLAYVRDAQSLAYAEAVVPGGKLRLAPDFTNLLTPELPERLAGYRGAGLVIPNRKVADMEGSGPNYVRFMVAAIEAIVAAGIPATILVHEGEGDRELAEEVNAGLPRAVPIVAEPSALDTKAVIAASHLVVSSRFHGLVSALSSAVPALACGWSHKYRELMDGYGCGDFTVSLADDVSWAEQLRRLIVAASDDGFRRQLQARAEGEKRRAREMWDEVFALIAKLPAAGQ